MRTLLSWSPFVTLPLQAWCNGNIRCLSVTAAELVVLRIICPFKSLAITATLLDGTVAQAMCKLFRPFESQTASGHVCPNCFNSNITTLTTVKGGRCCKRKCKGDSYPRHLSHCALLTLSSDSRMRISPKHRIFVRDSNDNKFCRWTDGRRLAVMNENHPVRFTEGTTLAGDWAVW